MSSVVFAEACPRRVWTTFTDAPERMSTIA